MFVCFYCFFVCKFAANHTLYKYIWVIRTFRIEQDRSLFLLMSSGVSDLWGQNWSLFLFISGVSDLWWQNWSLFLLMSSGEGDLWGHPRKMRTEQNRTKLYFSWCLQVWTTCGGIQGNTKKESVKEDVQNVRTSGRTLDPKYLNYLYEIYELFCRINTIVNFLQCLQFNL